MVIGNWLFVGFFGPKKKRKNEKSFSGIVSSRKPFGLSTNFNDFKEKEFKNSIKIYANKKTGFVPKDKILQNKNWIEKYKLFVPKAIGSGNIKEDWLKPIIGEPKSACTETYIVLGPFDSKKEVENAYSYTQTKFFHFLFGLIKITQDATSKVYKFVPMQDFSKPWTDEELYKKYDLTKEEIDFIESMVRPMD